MSSINTSCDKFECKVCGKIYKRYSGLAKHKIEINNANTMKSTVYNLPERAIKETWQTLVYHIKEKLKQNSKHAGSVCIMISCTESHF